MTERWTYGMLAVILPRGSHTSCNGVVLVGPQLSIDGTSHGGEQRPTIHPEDRHDVASTDDDMGSSDPGSVSATTIGTAPRYPLYCIYVLHHAVAGSMYVEEGRYLVPHTSHVC